MYEIIMNPNGASGSAKKVFLKVEKILNEKRIPFHLHCSTKEHDLDLIAKEVTQGKEDVDLIVMGGDGTLNKVINGIEDLSKVTIGYIPCGSGNDFAKALAISKNVEKNLTHILERKKRPIDIGEVTYFNGKEVTQRYIVSSGIGFDAAICERADRSPFKKYLNAIKLGKLIYTISAIEIIFETQRIQAKVKVNGNEVFHGQMLATVCMNSCYEGGGFMFCPKANPFDEQLDVCVFGNLTKFGFFRIFPFAIIGKHTIFKEVNEYRFNQIEVVTKEPMWFHTDGEVTCKTDHLTMRLHEHPLNIYN